MILQRRRSLTALSSKLILFAVFIFALTASYELLSPFTPRASAALQPGQDQDRISIAPEVRQQIESLMAPKRSRSPLERRIDSQLLFALRAQRGLAITTDVTSLELNVEASVDGHTVVDITCETLDPLLRKLDDIDADVLSAVRAYKAVRARIRLDQLEEIAAVPGVRFIQPKRLAITNRVKSALARLTANADLVAEGDAVHLAGRARADFGMNGSSVKVGVLSDGVESLRVSQSRNAIGPVTVLPGQTGTGDEGTAMLEIIHSLAPSAQLFFATAFTSPESFAENIRALRRLGCDIIVDDVFYLNESAFQDGQDINLLSETNGGVIAQAVNEVTASGALYFSSAGNSGNLLNNTSNIWEGDFKDGGNSFGPLPIDAGRIHDFGNGRVTNQITASTSFPVTLQWSDPLGGSGNDYDLYILNNAATSILAASLNFQQGKEDPLEIVGAQPAGRRIVVAKYSGENRFIQVVATRGRLAIATQGGTFGHSAGAGALSVAASPASLPIGPPPNPVGPFPNPFNSASKVEVFSSDGPRRLFFRADATPFTPGDLLSTGGILRQKPNITAADGTTVTGVGLFPTPFFGTSAAAPHAAAIAALLKSSNPAFTSVQIRNALVNSAIDIELPGVDAVSGSGIVMATNAAVALGLVPAADVELGTVALREGAGNGNSRVDPGETGLLTIELRNLGAVAATSVKAALRSTSLGVLVGAQGFIDYGNIAPRGGVVAGPIAHSFTVSSVTACDARIAFELELAYSGGPSPKVLHFEVPIGPGAIDIVSTLDTQTPSPGSRFTAVTGTQNGRMIRTFTPSGCLVDKPYPGLSATGPRRFDAYSFSTCESSTPTCITVSLTSACPGRLFAAAYVDRFDPTDVGLNYLGDSGDGPLENEEVAFSFSVPAGRSFVIVVHELNPTGGLGCSYNLKVNGLCDSCTGANLFCVQDDDSGDSLLFNFLNGDYMFNRCVDGSALAGRGDVGRSMGAITLRDGPRVHARVEKESIASQRTGAAQIRLNSLGRTFLINDRNMLNSRCSCP